MPDGVALRPSARLVFILVPPGRDERPRDSLAQNDRVVQALMGNSARFSPWWNDRQLAVYKKDSDAVPILIDKSCE